MSVPAIAVAAPHCRLLHQLPDDGAASPGIADSGSAPH